MQTKRPTPTGRGIGLLEALDFFMADIQAGIGPFLGVFLLAHGWRSGLIGSVMTIGGVARLLHGTGRVNVGQGVVMTVQGLGAALSPAIGRWIAQGIAFGPTFLILGSFAFGAIALWLGFAPTLKPACAGPAEGCAHPAGAAA